MIIQVWDYVGDGYVHRLLYHKGEGHVRAAYLTRVLCGRFVVGYMEGWLADILNFQ